MFDPVDEEPVGGHRRQLRHHRRHLAGMEEHAPDLHRLARPPEPAHQPGRRPAAGALAAGEGGEIARPEPDQRVVAREERDHDLPLPAVEAGGAVVEGTDLDEGVVGDVEPGGGLALEAEAPRLRRAVHLPHDRHPLLQPGPQGGRQRLGGDHGPLETERRAAEVLGLLEEGLQVAGQADVGGGGEVAGGPHRQVEVADAGRHHPAAEGPGPLLEHHPGRREVVAEAVEDGVAGPEPRRLQGRGDPPGVVDVGLGLVERAGRLEDPANGRARGEVPAEGRVLGLEVDEVVLGEDRQPVEGGHVDEVVGDEPGVGQPGGQRRHGLGGRAEHLEDPLVEGRPVGLQRGGHSHRFRRL